MTTLTEAQAAQVAAALAEVEATDSLVRELAAKHQTILKDAPTAGPATTAINLMTLVTGFIETFATNRERCNAHVAEAIVAEGVDALDDPDWPDRLA